MVIWDLHCHLNGVEGKTPEERIAKLFEIADRMPVHRLCFFMGIPPFSQNPTPDDFRKENDEVLQALAHWHDRAFGFVYLNPLYVHQSLQELERCVRDGPMVGVKLWGAGKCSADQIDPIIKRAHELNAVIFQHTWFKSAGNLKGESSPDDLARLAERHPEIPLICGHTGGDWERGIRAIRKHQNVSIGTGGFDPTAGAMEMAVRELGPRRIIYGSDIGGRSFASQIAKVTDARIPASAKRLILAGNLQRMLQPILKRKGVKI